LKSHEFLLHRWKRKYKEEQSIKPADAPQKEHTVGWKMRLWEESDDVDRANFMKFDWIPLF
jgi:hypothetical protein